MADVDLQVRVNRRIRLTFTVGEDRTVELLLQDGNLQLPIDLTGAKLTLALPKSGGGAIKRRTGGLVFSWSQVTNQGGMAVFAIPAHGLVTGDTVQLAAVGDGASLPAPFASTTPYVVIYISAKELALVATGTALSPSTLVLGAPATGQAVLQSDDFTVLNAALGQASCRLTAPCTNACAVGQGQDYQLVYTDAQGLTRIFTGSAMLDVMGQPDYLEDEAESVGG